MKKNIFDKIKSKLSLALATGTILASGCATLNSPVNNHLPEEANPKEEYALLINGDKEWIHDITFASNKLKEIGYKPENIITLGGEFFPKSVYNKNFKSGRTKSFNSAIKYLENKVDDNDSLLVYTIGYGASCEGIGYFVFEDKVVDIREIVDSINKIPFDKLIYIGSHGHADAVVNELRNLDRNIIAIAPITDIFGGFELGFWEASGNLDYDLNEDGKVDVKEAYEEGMRTLNSHFPLCYPPIPEFGPYLGEYPPIPEFGPYLGEYLVKGKCVNPKNIGFLQE